MPQRLIGLNLYIILSQKRTQLFLLEEGISGRLTFSVYNNGKPMDKEIAEKINDLGKVPVPEMKKAFPDKQKGYGVINIATRLRLKYGDQVEFGYEVLEEGTRCVIKLPVDGKENYEQ